MAALGNFTNAQLDAFFTNGPQMALPNEVRIRLAQEGLVTVDDFSDFKESQLIQAYKNMRTSIPGIPAVLNPDGSVAVAAVPAIQPCLVSARCALRLKVASIAYHYYVDVGRNPTPANMNYTNVLKAFYVQWEAIMTLANEDKPVIPVLSKHQTPLKWMESFRDAMSRLYGVRHTPVSYVIRDDALVTPEVDDPLLPGESFGASGSVLEELIARLNHTDPLFRTDNATVYSALDEATRGTIYAPTIKPFARLRNGRGAWLAIIASNAGNDKWEQVKKDKLNFLMNVKWIGRTYSLDKFTGLHRNAYVLLEEAAQHVNFQLPTEYSRVGFLCDNITHNDPDLRAALASIRVNTNNMRNNFEDAVAFLLPVCPYAKHKQSQRGRRAEISDTQLKSKSQSRTGVDFRWHTTEEYRKLSKAQRQELYQWQQTKEGKDLKNKANSKRNMSKKQMTAHIHSLEL